MNTINWGEVYFDHWTQLFKDREPEKSFVFKPTAPQNGASIQVLSYPRIFKNCITYCSLGLTHYRTELDALVEIVCPVDLHPEARPAPRYPKVVPEIIANLMYFAIGTRIPISKGIAISGISRLNQNFFSSTQKDALYFTSPFCLPPEFAHVRSGSESGCVLLAAFISAAEYEHLLSAGGDALETILEEGNVDVFDLNRKSAI